MSVLGKEVPASLAKSSVHALLLYGHPGAQKIDRIFALAKMVMCPASEDGAFCDECQVCRSVNQGTAMDLIHLTPAPPSDILRVDMIVPVENSKYPGIPVVDFVRLFPAAARRRVVIIERCEKMNSAAANALLKTLEEPNPRVRFFLTSDSIGNVLSTIRSRCLTVFCPVQPLEPDTKTYETVFSERSPGLLDSIRTQAETYEKLWDFFESLSGLKATSALKASETFRNFTDEFDSKVMGGVRAVHLELLRCFACWLASVDSSNISARKRVISVHSQVQQNGNMVFLMDYLFTELFFSEGKELSLRGKE